MKNKNIILLDTDAVSALFPEGSEPELKLKQAAIQRAAKKFAKGVLGDEAKKHLTEISKTVSLEIQKSDREAIIALLGPDAANDWKTKVVLPKHVVDQIKTVVTTEVNQKIIVCVNEATDFAVNAALNKFINNKHIEHRINEIFSAKVAAIIKNQSEIAAARLIDVLGTGSPKQD